MKQKLAYHYFPLSNGSLVAVIIDTYLHKSLSICRIRYQITFVIYLLQSLISRFVVFQLHHINRIRHVKNNICPTDGTIFFHLDISTQEIEDKIKYGLEIFLILIGQTI